MYAFLMQKSDAELVYVSLMNIYTYILFARRLAVYESIFCIYRNIFKKTK